MIKSSIKIITVIALSAFTSTAYSQSMTLSQVLQKVLDHYPSVKVAAIQVERARQEGIKVESQLGWQLAGKAGIRTDVSPFGIGSDTLDASGSLSKQIASGSTLSIDASLSYEDSEIVFSPLLPDPTTITRVDLTYRERLAKGLDNPGYTEGKVSADAGVIIKKAEKEKLYDQLADQVIELYLSAAITKVRMSNISNAVKRTRRLQKFIKNRENLGISEEKDALQVNAQLINQQAELSGLKIVWLKQQFSLNRLMGLAADETFIPVFESEDNATYTFEKVYGKSKQHSPELKIIDGRIMQADSAIRIQRDADKDNLDLVLFIGARNQSGDVVSGNVNETDLIGGARLEFFQNQDKRGLNAQLYQAQLDRSAAIEDKRRVLEDLHYDISSLLTVIEAGYDAVAAYKKSVKSENNKLKEAAKRYKTGRADTDQLIQFESQLSVAELSLELQQIELVRRSLSLQLKQGFIWNSIHLPQINNYLNEERP